MAMVQSLLVRSLVAWFWDEPLRAPLIRHGANLHGRYLLPHFLIHDIADVAADLRAHGIDFDTSWLDPFTEFRFPRHRHRGVRRRGDRAARRDRAVARARRGVHRRRHGPLRRLVGRAPSGPPDRGGGRQRYIVTCNGFPVPLLADRQSRALQVGGVRYRAWQPPSCAAPDHHRRFAAGLRRGRPAATRGGVSLGGATYHVSHPGGRSYDNPPVNAVEAEARRTRRFDAAGHSPGAIDIAQLRERAALLSVDSGPVGILDLRRARAITATTEPR